MCRYSRLNNREKRASLQRVKDKTIISIKAKEHHGYITSIAYRETNRLGVDLISRNKSVSGNSRGRCSRESNGIAPGTERFASVRSIDGKESRQEECAPTVAAAVPGGG